MWYSYAGLSYGVEWVCLCCKPLLPYCSGTALGVAAKAGSDSVLTAHNTSVFPVHDNMQDGFPRSAAVPEFGLTTLTEGRGHRKDESLQED